MYNSLDFEKKEVEDRNMSTIKEINTNDLIDLVILVLVTFMVLVS